MRRRTMRGRLWHMGVLLLIYSCINVYSDKTTHNKSDNNSKQNSDIADTFSTTLETFTGSSTPEPELFSPTELEIEPTSGTSSHHHHVVPTWRPRRENCTPPAIEQFPQPLMSPNTRKHGGLVVHVFVAIFTFLGLAIVCDDYFVSSLDRLCEELKLSPDVAGATFMAAGSSAPELATVVIGVFFAKDDIGISGVIGSAVFNIMFVISVCALCSGTVCQLNWWPLVRDCFFYALSILVMLMIIINDTISWLICSKKMHSFLWCNKTLIPLVVCIVFTNLIQICATDCSGNNRHCDRINQAENRRLGAERFKLNRRSVNLHQRLHSEETQRDTLDDRRFARVYEDRIEEERGSRGFNNNNQNNERFEINRSARRTIRENNGLRSIPRENIRNIDRVRNTIKDKREARDIGRNQARTIGSDGRISLERMVAREDNSLQRNNLNMVTDRFRNTPRIERTNGQESLEINRDGNVIRSRSIFKSDNKQRLQINNGKSGRLVDDIRSFDGSRRSILRENIRNEASNIKSKVNRQETTMHGRQKSSLENHKLRSVRTREANNIVERRVVQDYKQSRQNQRFSSGPLNGGIRNLDSNTRIIQRKFVQERRNIRRLEPFTRTQVSIEENFVRSRSGSRRDIREIPDEDDKGQLKFNDSPRTFENNERIKFERRTNRHRITNENALRAVITPQRDNGSTKQHQNEDRNRVRTQKNENPESWHLEQFKQQPNRNSAIIIADEERLRLAKRVVENRVSVRNTRARDLEQKRDIRISQSRLSQNQNERRASDRFTTQNTYRRQSHQNDKTIDREFVYQQRERIGGIYPDKNEIREQRRVEHLQIDRENYLPAIRVYNVAEIFESSPIKSSMFWYMLQMIIIGIVSLKIMNKQAADCKKPSFLIKMESLVMLMCYVVYCITLHFNSSLEKWAHSLKLPIKLPSKEEQSALVTYKNLPDTSYTQGQSTTAPDTTQQHQSNQQQETNIDQGYNAYYDPNASWDPNAAWGENQQPAANLAIAAPIAPAANSWGDGYNPQANPDPLNAWDSSEGQKNYGYNSTGDQPIETKQNLQQVQATQPQVPQPRNPDFYKSKEVKPGDIVNPLDKPTEGGIPAQISWAIVYPIHYMCRLTMPDCRTERFRNWYPFTFVVSMIWISFYSYFMVWMITIIGATLGIPDTVMGLTFVAAGVSVPDALSSIAVIKEGYGDMAVSNAVGSNVFDILVCLGLPWFIQTAIIKPGSHVNVISKGLTYSTLSLLSTVVFLLCATHLNGWKLDKRLGIVLMFWYFLFITIASLYELNVFGQLNQPECSSSY